MAEITKKMAQHLSANLTMSKKDIIFANFLGGLAWGLGTVVGAVVIVAIVGGALNWLGFFDFLQQIPSAPKLYR